MSDSLRIENLSRATEMGGIPFTNETSALGRMGSQADALSAGETTKTFSQILKKSMEQVNEHQVQADHAIQELVAGRSKNIHETMLAIERADTSLKLMMQVRNKILDAYREVMRMQV